MKASPRKDITGLAGPLDHCIGLERGQTHRLFAQQHTFPAPAALMAHSAWLGWRRGNIDGVNFRVVQQRRIAVDNAGSGKAFGLARLVRITRADGDQLSGLGMGDATGERLGDIAGSNNTPANLGNVIHANLLYSYL